MESLSIMIGTLGIAIFLIIYVIYSYGVLTFYFYGWFILPVFTNLPHITLIQAMGISFFIGLFHGNGKTKYKKLEEEHDYWRLVTPWIVLLIGYCFKTYWLN